MAKRLGAAATPITDPAKPAARSASRAAPSTVVPPSDAAVAKRASLPKLPRNVMFTLLYHPERYTVLESGAVVPVLKHLPHEPGVGNVDEIADRSGRGPARVVVKPAISDAEERGWTAIPHTAAPNGVSYVHAVQVDGGRHYLSIFETAHVGSDHVSTDQPAYVAWLRGLEAKGIIPRPAIYVIDRLREQVVRALGQAVGRASKDDKFQTSVRIQEARLKAVDEYLAELRTADASSIPAAKADATDLPAVPATVVTPPEE